MSGKFVFIFLLIALIGCTVSGEWCWRPLESDNYVVNQDYAEEKKCVECTFSDEESDYTCIRCFNGYEPVSGKCEPCLEGYTSSGYECNACADGYREKPSAERDTINCVPCPQGTTGTGGECDQCAGGYYKVETYERDVNCVAMCRNLDENTPKSYIPNTDDSPCEVCSEDGNCEVCSNLKYGPNCDQPCPNEIDHCALCSNSNGTCVLCEEGYTGTATDDPYNYTCDKCADGYYNAGGSSIDCLPICYEEPVTRNVRSYIAQGPCASCSDDGSCTDCVPGKYGLNCDMDCSDAIEHCSECSFDGTMCYDCEGNFEPDLAGMLCVVPPECTANDECDDENAPQCKDGSCVACESDAGCVGHTGSKCENGKCVVPSGGDDECTSNDECDDENAPQCKDGSCVACESDAGCVGHTGSKCENGKCVVPSGGDDECSSDADCTADETKPICSEGSCVACSADTQCASHEGKEHCDTDSGKCVAPPVTPVVPSSSSGGDGGMGAGLIAGIVVIAVVVAAGVITFIVCFATAGRKHGKVAEEFFEAEENFVSMSVL